LFKWVILLHCTSTARFARNIKIIKKGVVTKPVFATSITTLETSFFKILKAQLHSVSIKECNCHLQKFNKCNVDAVMRVATLLLSRSFFPDLY
jgi:hypothetical protein